MVIGREDSDIMVSLEFGSYYNWWLNLNLIIIVIDGKISNKNT